VGLLSSYPTTTTLDSTDVFPLADTDNKIKTITAPALVAALYTLDPPPAASTGSGPVVGVNPSLSVPELSNWTLRSAATGTTMTQPVAGGPIVVFMNESTSNQMQMATVAVPSGTPWTKSMLLEWDGGFDNDQIQPFLILFDNASGALLWAGLYLNNAYIQEWSNSTSPGSTLVTTAHARPQAGAYWLRASFDGTTVTISGSKNNVVWWTIGSVALSATSLAAITDIGIGQNMGTNGPTPPATMFIWNMS